MPKLNLNERRANRPKNEMLELEIGDKVFKIPLGSDILYDEMAKLTDAEHQREFFAHYIDESVMATLTVADITDIMTAWSDATTKAAGIDTGKS